MKKNKLIAVASLALAALAGKGAGALTPGQGDIVTDNGTITINQVADSGDTFKACKIVDVLYHQSSNTVEYAFTSAFTNWQSSLPSGNAFKNITISDYMAYANGTASGQPISGNATIDQLAGALAASNSFSGSCTDMTTSGTSATVTAPYGAYLIVPKPRNDTAMSKSYGAMIANLAVKEENGQYVLDNTYATLNAKASDVGTVTKTSKKNGTATDTFAQGDVFQYEITANAPTYPANATNKTFAVTDTMENGISFDSYGTITSGGNTLTVDTNDSTCGPSSNKKCIKNGNSSVGYVDEQGQTIVYYFDDITATPSPIVITYNASLNNNATLGNKNGQDTVNENSASIMVPKNYYDTNSGWEVSDPSVKNVFTFGITINKLDENSQPLSGAKFDICEDQNCSTVIASIDMSNANTYNYRSLAEGTYYIKETQAPTGYKLLANPTTVTIARASSPNDGYFVSAITNEKATFSLPFTGGRGVIVYAILGVGIVGIASAYYIRKRKQQA